MNEDASEWSPVSVSFPQARVKKVMKADREVGSIQQDALLRMTSSAEVFLEFLTKEASKNSEKDKRKTVTYKDVAATISNDSRFAFLWEVIPKPVPLAEALEFQKRRKAELGEAIAGIVDIEEAEDENGGSSSKAQTSSEPTGTPLASQSHSSRLPAEMDGQTTPIGSHDEELEGEMMIIE